MLPEMQISQKTSDRIVYVCAAVFTASLVLASVSAGVNGAAKIFFGSLSVSASAKTALLPLGLLGKDWECLIMPIKDSLLGNAIAFGGLYACTDAHLLNYFLPAAIATWIYAARAIYYQGLDSSVGRSEASGKKFSTLHLLY